MSETEDTVFESIRFNDDVLAHRERQKRLHHVLSDSFLQPFRYQGMERYLLIYPFQQFRPSFVRIPVPHLLLQKEFG